MTVSTLRSNLGRPVFGAAALVFGLIALVWHGYNDWHPPRYLVYAAAAALILGGAAIPFRRTAKTGAVVLGAVYLAFALQCVPEVIAKHTNWSETVENFAIAGTAWILVDLLGEYRLNEHRPR